MDQHKDEFVNSLNDIINIFNPAKTHNKNEKIQLGNILKLIKEAKKVWEKVTFDEKEIFFQLNTWPQMKNGRLACNFVSL